MFDLFNFFTRSEVESVDANAISAKTDHILANDNFIATLKYTDGSICSLTYTALGSNDAGKEYIEIYCDGKIFILDDFRSLKIYGLNKKGWEGSQDKGHLQEMETFGKCLKSGGEWPLSLEDMVSATTISFIVDRMIKGIG